MMKHINISMPERWRKYYYRYGIGNQIMAASAEKKT